MTIRISPGADDMMLDERPIIRDYETKAFEQRVAAKALDILKDVGGDTHIADADMAMDYFAEVAAELVTASQTETCSRCGEMHPDHAMSYVYGGTFHGAPQRVCVNCLYTNGGN